MNKAELLFEKLAYLEKEAGFSKKLVDELISRVPGAFEEADKALKSGRVLPKDIEASHKKTVEAYNAITAGNGELGHYMQIHDATGGFDGLSRQQAIGYVSKNVEGNLAAKMKNVDTNAFNSHVVAGQAAKAKTPTEFQPVVNVKQPGTVTNLQNAFDTVENNAKRVKKSTGLTVEETKKRMLDVYKKNNPRIGGPTSSGFKNVDTQSPLVSSSTTNSKSEDTFNKYKDQASNWIKKNPGKTVAIGLGAGTLGTLALATRNNE